MFPGVGTVVNVIMVLAGAGLGVALGHRIPDRVRDLVVDTLGLATLLIGGLSAWAVTDTTLSSYVGSRAPMLIVLGSLVLGGIAGALLRVQERIESIGGLLQSRLSRSTGSIERHRFIEGFVTASLVFCTGPLTVLGALNDGLGHGADQLFLKATLDGFAAIAFAASFGWGVAASAVTVVVVQGALTIVGVLLGDVLPDPHLAALTATGGLLLVGVGLRLLRIREIPVADLLPALVVAPVLVQVVGAVTG
jgi:uncharacterized protein